MIMLLIIISFVLALINLTAMYCISHHKPMTGWRTVLGLQAPWLIYNLVVGQWAFVFMTVVNAVMAYKSIRNVKRTTKNAGEQA